jgi:uncharacterized protein
MKYSSKIATELGLKEFQVEAVAALLEADATVPFIARYRKEQTGSMDEVQISQVRDRMAKLQELDDRRDSIIASLTERNLLTDELAEKIALAESLTVLEDIYLPFRPKRRTKAMIARERGLEPLATIIFKQEGGESAETLAEQYIDPSKEVPDVLTALAGARDIIAEQINEDSEARSEMRDFYAHSAVITTKVIDGKEEEGAKFSDYFECSDPVAGISGHRLLAMFRAEKEGFISISCRPEADSATELLKRRFVTGKSSLSEQVSQAAEAGYKRLMAPSMEVELRMNLFNKAGDEAIVVFASNLRELLMASPLGRKAVLAIDPGIRTGCKVVCLDPQGKLLYDCVIQLAASDAQRREAAGLIVALCKRYNIEAIAVGNGTYGREAIDFVRSIGLPPTMVIVSVNESGASIYSASEVAREEFPDKDVTVRGSVSIGRRLMDPLAELVKLDPKSIGVGQYQHDVDQTKLKASLDDVVMSCVNSVGVEVNTASRQLLTYVSGIGPTIAENIVKYRDENGPFKARKDLLKVPRLGNKAFEQCAGFMRIADSENPLDASAVHPERYALVGQMAKDMGCEVSALMNDTALISKINIKDYVTDEIGLPTLNDIISELAKPGRDPRKEFEVFNFAEGIMKPSDLQTGMKLPGIVTNVTNFGAFVDVGVHQDGLVHISELSDNFVSNPADVLKVGQKVQVTVLAVDEQRNRISLSMKSIPGSGAMGGAVRRERREGQPSQNNSNRNDRRDRDRGFDRRDNNRNNGGGGFGSLGSAFGNLGL